MKFFSKNPKLNWTRLTFNENDLNGLSDRQKAELETIRDLTKPIEQLVCDVHEETHNKDRNELQNIAIAQKRFVSLIARLALTNDKLSKKIFWLTLLMTLLTLAIGLLTYLMWLKTA